MLGSIHIGTSGLIGFSKQLQTISNNVANLNTPGFKGSNAQFTAFFSEGGNSALRGHGGGQTGSGLGTLPSVVNFSQGQINQTGNDLDAAINGNGFFVLRSTSGQLLYTRDGQFKFDEKGILVNANGDHVQALNAQGVLQDISLNGVRTNSASASSTITMNGTLSNVDTDKLIGGVTVTDSAGGTHTLSVNFHNNTAVTPGSWLVTIKDGTTTVGTGEIRFASGLLDPAFNTVSLTYSPAGAAAMPLTLTMDPSSTNPTSGVSSLAVSSVDGFGTGDLTQTTFDADGNLVLTYSNGQTTKVQTLALATFSSSNDLHAVNGNNFTSTNQQGVSLRVAKTSNTTISADALEASNVDLSQEFSDIIVTQRGYQAASELISTANQMLDTLMRMKG
ncbi:MAG: flagellar basal-body rod protein FlgF [Pseudomonadota bacterium]